MANAVEMKKPSSSQLNRWTHRGLFIVAQELLWWVPDHVALETTGD